MDSHTVQEYTYMHLILSEAHDDDMVAITLYVERYPQCRLTNLCTYHTINHHIRETSTVEDRSVQTVDVEECILRRVEENGCIICKGHEL
jgi:hypothetical protein